MAFPPRAALRLAGVHGLNLVSTSRCSSLSQPKRRIQCHAKKSKKKQRSAEKFEERPVDEDVEAAAEQQLDSTEAELADTHETVYEALDEEPVQEQQRYQAEAPAPPPQASSSGSSDLVRLGALGLGAVALIAAVVFAIKRFAKQKLPEEEKVRFLHIAFVCKGLHQFVNVSITACAQHAVFTPDTCLC